MGPHLGQHSLVTHASCPLFKQKPHTGTLKMDFGEVLLGLIILPLSNVAALSKSFSAFILIHVFNWHM